MQFSGQVPPTLAPKVRRTHPIAPVCVTLLALISMQTETVSGYAQSATPPVATQQTPTAQPNTPATPSPTSATAEAKDHSEHAGEITEDELKQQLVGKPLFLRGGYLGDSLSFTEHGDPTGHPVKGSYTLSAVQIDKVHLTKHRVELEGSRYALHFLGALPSEDPSKAVDRIKITPKKKVLKISIDREQVVKPKKAKELVKEKAKKPATPATAVTHAAPKPEITSSETAIAPPTPAPNATATAAEQTVTPTATPAAPPTTEPSPDQAAAEPATPGTDKTDQAADQASVTTTLSPAHAAQVLREALDKVFATGLDEKLRAQMPDFWQLYYQAQTAGVDYRPTDPKVLRSTAVDQQAKVLSSIAPDSNEFAQSSGIAGRALYRAVIGADGKPGEICVVRPIGFGLDENAVAAIRKASFQPAIKGGQPVAETLDLAVLFRIYSKRTSVAATDTPAPDSTQPKKPGPYSVQQPKSNP